MWPRTRIIDPGFIREHEAEHNEFWALWHSLYPIYREIYPTMNRSFYQDSIYEKFSDTEKSDFDILVCGAADEDMLKLLDGITGKDSKTERCNITLIDFCQVALGRNQHYANERGMKIKFVYEDILKYNCKEKYDIIVSDGFIDYFNDEKKKELLHKWKSLLRDEGIVITTAPILRLKGKIPLDIYKEASLCVESLKKSSNPLWAVLHYQRLKKTCSGLTTKYGENKPFGKQEAFFDICNGSGLSVKYFEHFLDYKHIPWSWYNIILKKPVRAAS